MKPVLGRLAVFNAAGNAGPRRLMFLAIAGLAVLALVVVVATTGRHLAGVSRDAHMKPVDPLPGGLHATPEEEALDYQAGDARAQAALGAGGSFTPPLAASVRVLASPPEVEQAIPQPVVHPHPVFAGRPQWHPAVARPVFPAALMADPPDAESQPAPIRVAAAGDPKADQAYSQEIGDLFSQWGGRAPRTDVVLPPRNGKDAPSQGGTTDAPANPPLAGTAPAASAASASEILVPAGRGVFAHPVLAVNSDQSSPVVLQADSGPIAGDRMIGTFARQNDRLVIHINTVIHQGQSLSVDGLVVAPDTMEAGVASGVDQHYLSRFVLPAAAAFLEGLGQAIATTSNTATVLSPFGGASYATQLNLKQQTGVAAGVAAAQVGATLNAAAPKGPTVSLDANVAVGVMFLSNVTMHRPS
ncbi:MAG TPA: DotG/IcmE/VirB10 family protein [Stellaceae bacterium]|nr:DotG/IcmE/VirB10 family protein [Stellaceae bacterium]HUC12413.1 DotG/IcmE/VirB10 family protein [Stellaceae bacterium]